MGKNKKKKHLDLTVGLLTGKFEKSKTPEGRTIEQFIPSIVNRNPTLKILERNNPNMGIQSILVQEGLIARPLLLNPEEFRKTNEEKVALKIIKKEHNQSLRAAGFNPKMRLNVSEPAILRPN